ncbi:sulfite exporter TauE/SafE family protein [Chloroflexota bacterium]
MFSLGTILLLNLIFFVASVVPAVTGFGGGLVAIPIMTFFMSPKIAVPLLTLVWLAIDIPLTIECRKEVNFKRVGLLFAGAALTVPLGVFGLAGFSSAVVEIIMSVIIIVTCLLFLKNIRWKIQRESLALFLIGLTSGVLEGMLAMGGPPVMLLGVNQQWPEKELRANAIAFFLTTKTFRIPLLFYTRLLDARLALWSLPTLFGIVLGCYLGAKLLKKRVLARRQLLTKLILILLLITAATVLIRRL